jgi:hypothetical protein
MRRVDLHLLVLVFATASNCSQLNQDLRMLVHVSRLTGEGGLGLAIILEQQQILEGRKLFDGIAVNAARLRRCDIVFYMLPGR